MPNPLCCKPGLLILTFTPFSTRHPFVIQYLKMYRAFHQNFYNWKKKILSFSCRFFSCSYSKLYVLFAFFFFDSRLILFTQTKHMPGFFSANSYLSRSSPAIFMQVSASAWFRNFYVSLRSWISFCLCFQFVRILVLSSLSLFPSWCTLWI